VDGGGPRGTKEPMSNASKKVKKTMCLVRLACQPLDNRSVLSEQIRHEAQGLLD
jgi:hypothetical protein